MPGSWNCTCQYQWSPSSPWGDREWGSGSGGSLLFCLVQLLSCVWHIATPWPARLPCLSPTPGACSNSSISLVMPSNHLILYCPLLLLPLLFLSIRVFSTESVLCIRWLYWSFSFSISPSNEYSGLTSFRMKWLDLAVDGTLKSFLQHHSSKASILRCSVFFTVQLSHPYMTTGKTIALTRWTFVGKLMSLLSYILSRLVIAFLPRSNCLNFMAAVTICSDFGSPPNKVYRCFHCFPIFHEVMGPDAMILVFWMLTFRPTFSLSSFTSIKRLFSFSSLSARWQGLKDHRSMVRNLHLEKRGKLIIIWELDILFSIST